MMTIGSTIAAGTAAAGKGSGMGTALLGRSGFTVSQVGFGGYRVAAGVPEHAAALSRALDAGVNLIDTSANYTDGGSEELVGQLLENLIEAGRLRRAEVVVVSKAGYLQGKNYALSQERRRQGNPFPELVPYAEGLEYCIHPEFLADQLHRSLGRLRLESLDVYLLHNPEYFLGWAHKSGMEPAAAQAEYFRRIEAAFRYLEAEVDGGRIRWYGISSNTFPVGAAEPQFNCLEKVWEIAQGISRQHHFGVVQLPMNLFETGAVLTPNQPSGATVLEFTRRQNLGVLINRPLNAFTGNRLFRLAEVRDATGITPGDVAKRLEALADTERVFVERLLPDFGLEAGFAGRVQTRLLVAGPLSQAWRSFSGYDHWLQVRDEYLLPRVRGVLELVDAHAAGRPEAMAWKDAYSSALNGVILALGGFHAAAAAQRVGRIKAALSAADPDWGGPAPLSRLAVRCLRTTMGVSSVLVGMRRPAYVDDMLAELAVPVAARDRRDSWGKLDRLLKEAVGSP